MAEGRERKLSDLLKRGYSDDELGHIYELGHFHIENGELVRAEIIMNGLVAVAPEFIPAWLALTYIELMNGNTDNALAYAKQSHRIDPTDIRAGLFLVTVLLKVEDVATAGTCLGEVGDLIEGSQESDPSILRFYKAQLARFRNS